MAYRTLRSIRPMPREDDVVLATPILPPVNVHAAVDIDGREGLDQTTDLGAETCRCGGPLAQRWVGVVVSALIKFEKECGVRSGEAFGVLFHERPHGTTD
jgi:hypothetical protein